MVARHLPPSLTSIETVDTGTSASLPPYQSAKRSGSVHSFHTCSRGASKTRVIVIPSAMLGFLLARSQARLEAVEAALPEPTVLLQPFDGVPERRALAAARAEAAPCDPA